MSGVLCVLFPVLAKFFLPWGTYIFGLSRIVFVPYIEVVNKTKSIDKLEWYLSGTSRR